METKIEHIFKIITTQWQGDTMIFPKGDGTNILIHKKDIVELIKKAF